MVIAAEICRIENSGVVQGEFDLCRKKQIGASSHACGKGQDSFPKDSLSMP